MCLGYQKCIMCTHLICKQTPASFAPRQVQHNVCTRGGGGVGSGFLPLLCWVLLRLTSAVNQSLMTALAALCGDYKRDGGQW